MSYTNMLPAQLPPSTRQHQDDRETVSIVMAVTGPMPSHWKLSNLPPVLRFLFKLLCTIGVGQTDLDDVWESCKSDAAFDLSRQKLNQRISTVTVVAGLILGALAAFVTTEPPVVSLINYNSRTAYTLLFLAFGLTLGGLIVGSAVIYALTQTRRSWFLKTFTATRSRICCWLLLIGYPFLSIGCATIVSALGLLVAVWESHDVLIHSGATVVLIAPVSMVPVFLWTQFFVPPQESAVSSAEKTSDPVDSSDIILQDAEEGKAARFRK